MYALLKDFPLTTVKIINLHLASASASWIEKKYFTQALPSPKKLMY